MLFQHTAILCTSLALAVPFIKDCDIDTDIGDPDKNDHDEDDHDEDYHDEDDHDEDYHDEDDHDDPEDTDEEPEFDLCVNEYGTHPCYDSVQYAVDVAKPGHVIKVFPGEYHEPVDIDKPVALRGAKAGICGPKRGGGAEHESTIVGLITIQAPYVSIDGFSLTAEPVTNTAIGVLIETAGKGAVLANNIVHGITSDSDTAQAIYLENGPDDVSILCNHIFAVTGSESTKGIFIGDSTTDDASMNILIRDNQINYITSALKGAYGLLVNNGESTTIKVLDNKIFDLKGEWAHAIGLEGDTPYAQVKGNTIFHIVDRSPNTLNDSIGVFFEDNDFFSTVDVNFNKFEDVGFGIAVDPNPLILGTPVDGTCNWWGAPTGPGPVAMGGGVGVGSQVWVKPWLVSPDGPCTGYP